MLVIVNPSAGGGTGLKKWYRIEPVVKAIYSQHDHHEYGGAPLLGVKGTCLIAHGAAEARTITNAIFRAKQFVTAGVNDAIVGRLGALEELVA